MKNPYSTATQNGKPAEYDPKPMPKAELLKWSMSNNKTTHSQPVDMILIIAVIALIVISIYTYTKIWS